MDDGTGVVGHLFDRDSLIPVATEECNSIREPRQVWATSAGTIFDIERRDSGGYSRCVRSGVDSPSQIGSESTSRGESHSSSCLESKVDRRDITRSRTPGTIARNPVLKEGYKGYKQEMVARFYYKYININYLNYFLDSGT